MILFAEVIKRIHEKVTISMLMSFTMTHFRRLNEDNILKYFPDGNDKKSYTLEIIELKDFH